MMQTIKDIYRIGYGPSSSHTIGPMRIAQYFKDAHALATHYEVELYGSLSLTGKGHKTDAIIKRILGNVVFKFNHDFKDNLNKMILKAYHNDELIDTWHAESLGGGAIRIDEYETDDGKEVYKENNFEEVKKTLEKNNIDLLTYINQHENIDEYLSNVIDTMIDSIDRGLNTSGLMHEKLGLCRTAKDLYIKAKSLKDDDLKLMAYAYAASEENAMGNIVATAPTLGSCGIVASLIYYCLIDLKMNRQTLIDGLKIAGLFGNIVKNNASISGAIGGCQAEVGTAVAMASALKAYLDGSNLEIIEYAAEIGIEHHLGLTCDPVMGLVMIPCIERNAVGIKRAIDAAKLANAILPSHNHLVSFDMVVSSMRYTGSKLSMELKETSLGGLALEFENE